MHVPIRRRLSAWLYDATMRRLERRGLARIRREAVRRALGPTLEVGAGTGANLDAYPATVSRLVVTEPDAGMARRLERRAEAVRPDAQVVVTSADALPFADDTFETVVATLMLCTVPDQAAVLDELRRVLRPGGRLVFVEHVRSRDDRIARRQDRWRPAWRVLAGGCEPNRDTVRAIRDAGFEITDLRDDSMPGGPSIVRPLAVGVARRPPAG